jgi:glycosyltransferase involved in cell wall biosynthesis
MEYKVAILQHRLLHYRVDFFDRLRKLCLDRNIDCHLVHGQATLTEKSKNDEGVLEWADKTHNNYVRVGSRDILWQPLPDSVCDADLFVIMQENRILSNYPLMLRGKFGGPKVAYWGHGVNFQSGAPGGLPERWKHFLVRQVDWWFAYTDLTAEIVRCAGFPAERITCLNNAIDTSAFSKTVESITHEELTQIRKGLGLSDTSRVGILCGSLYSDKRLDLLVEATTMIRNKVKDFHVVVIGSGPAKTFIEQAASANPWLHPVGARFGREKAIYFKLAEVMVNPGVLGLHILDAFSVGLPVVSISNARHGPEIAYLHNGVNGVLTGDTVDEYAEAVTRLLSDEAWRESLSTNALASSLNYTVERMAERFVEGLSGCLAAGKLE